MDPFSMMMGYGLIQSATQLVVKPIADKLTSRDRQGELFAQIEKKHRLDIEVLRLNKKLDLENNADIQRLSHQLRISEAQKQFEQQIEMWRLGQFDSRVWPLRTPFDDPSLKPLYEANRPVPINIFLAKTDPRSSYAAILQSEVTNNLSNFITTTYSNLGSHPCICRIGDWKDGFQDAAFINALWYGLKGRPSLVINPIQSEHGETLNLNVSAWGLAQDSISPTTQTLLSGPFASAIGRIIREESIHWKENNLPIDSDDLRRNINLFEQEKTILSGGGTQETVDRLLPQYVFANEIRTRVITRFSKEYSHTVSCIAGLYIDIYHLIEHGTAPCMPQAINAYNHTHHNDYQIPAVVVDHYRKALTGMTCSNYLQERLPLAYFNVAQSVQYDSPKALEIFQEGVGLWVNRKLPLDQETPIPESLDECVRLLHEQGQDSDRVYLLKAKETLLALDESEAASQLDQKIICIPVENIHKNVPCEIYEIDEVTLLDIFEWGDNQKREFQDASFFQVDIGEQMIVASFLDEKKNILTYNDGGVGIFKFQAMNIPAEIKIENNPFTVHLNDFITIHQKIRRLYGHF